MSPVMLATENITINSMIVHAISFHIPFIILLASREQAYLFD